MAKHRTSISVDDDLADDLDNVNTSELVNDLLRRHFASEQKTKEEQLRDEIREEKEAIDDLRDEIESREAKINHLENELDDIEEEQDAAVDEVVEFAKKYMTKVHGARQHARSNASGTVGGVDKADLCEMLDDIIPDQVRQIRRTDSWDDLRAAGYPVDEDGLAGNQWDAQARDIVGLTAEQREEIEDWMAAQ
jgi:uncharacterized protein (DUF3084 family)